MTTVAISADFLESFSRIPASQQKKVREFTEKFQANPRSPKINYEKIHGVKDKKVRTVRIDLSYRAIVLHPQEGDVYLLVWVDHHDEAMAWAKDKRFEINPSTGSLQVFSVAAAETALTNTPTRVESSTNLFDEFSAELMVSVGVPEVLIPAVRAIETREQLVELGPHLPADAAESLFWLAEGVRPEEIFAALTVRSNEPINSDDFNEALKNPNTRRRFVTIESQYDLSTMLEGPLEKWRVFLHPSQAYLSKCLFVGPSLVLGGAGTGKTVVAMHRAKQLASTVFPDDQDRILFVTYSSNLAKNVEHNLKSLCGRNAARIEVTNLHSWAVRFMRSQGAMFEIANDSELRLAWQSAAQSIVDSWSVAFIRQEWEQVVMANDLNNRDEYLRFPRVGRGMALSRPDRSLIWDVFQRFQDSLNELGKLDWLEVIKATRRYITSNKLDLPYRSIVVDEVQDLHAEELRLIRKMVPCQSNDLFLVGDAHQRIYDRKTILSKCGIDVSDRIFRLSVNYRTTEQIRTWAVNLLKPERFDNLNGGEDDNHGYVSLMSGPLPEIHNFETAESENTFLEQIIKTLLDERPAEEISLVAPTNAAVNRYRSLIAKMGVPHIVLGKSDNRGCPGIRLSNMHRIKGLEFACVLVAGVNSDEIPTRTIWLDNDPIAKAANEIRERSLLFVAVTRARDKLIITSFGEPSPFLVSNVSDEMLSNGPQHKRLMNDYGRT